MAATERLEEAPPAASLVQVRVLGGFEVVVAGRAVARADWRRTAAARLFKLLAVTPGHRLTRELAAETLWPDAEPEASRRSLRKALYFARGALRHAGGIASDADLVSLETPLVDLDLDRVTRAFDVLAQRGRMRRTGDTRGALASPGEDGSPAEVAEAVTTVLEVGGQTLLPDDAYEDWLVGPRDRLRDRWQAVAIEAAREAVASERRAEAHTILRQLLERDPTDEEAHRIAIDLYALEGHYHAVRRQFELCRKALADGLDVSPSVETEAAYRRAELAAHGQRVRAAGSRLVGRRRELGLIESVLDGVSVGRFAALVIRGPAGIGKTSLLEAVRDRARGAGWHELAWQALESTRSIAFAPFAMRLADEVTGPDLEAWDEPAISGLATLVPSLGVTPHLTFADRSALVLALVKALGQLACRAPHLIAVDDLGALDAASLELLGTASSVLSSAPICLAVTYRDEEPLPEPACELVEILRRAGSIEIRLGPLAAGDVEPLVVEHLGGGTLAAPLAEALFGRSEGNPLFCIELAREASDSGGVRLEGGCWGLVEGGSVGEAPETVRHLVAARSRALPAPARELLRVAAELGQAEFGFDTLAAVLPDLGGELIPALDAALGSGLLVERGAGYAFGHPVYRAAVEAASGVARRAITHMAIARALAGIDFGENIAPGDVQAAAARSSDPTPIADHALRAFELGQHDEATLAVGFGLAAAGRARTLLDRAAATTLFGRALDVWTRLPERVAREFGSSDAFASLAELHTMAGDESAAESAFRSAIAAARDTEELAVAYERFTWLPYRHGDFPAAIALAEEGLARLPADASVGRAILRQALCRLHARLDPHYSGIAEYRDVLPVLEAAGKPAYLSMALDGLGCSYSDVGRPDEALTLLQRSLSIALDLRDGRLELIHRVHIASLLTIVGRPGEARPHLSRALELGDQMGEWYLESLCAWITAEMEHVLGNVEAARRMRLHELALLARTGGNPHHEAHARAHLAYLARLLGDPEAAEREAVRARELAARDPDPSYTAWIEVALSSANLSNGNWLELPPHGGTPEERPRHAALRP